MVITKKKKNGFDAIIYTAVLLCIVGFFVVCVNNFAANSNNDGKEILTEAVKKTAVHCYAIEGQYPESIDYLEQNYGLNYNKDKYIVKYQLIGSNIMPDIFVMEGE